MDLSLTEAATVLGRSERQIRYLIKTGRLPATRVQGRWRIARADLPLNEAQRQALAARTATAQAAFAKGIAPAVAATATRDAKDKKPYSVLDLEVFRTGVDLLRDVRTLATTAPTASLLAGQQLAVLLTQLTRGCHAYHPSEKAACFVRARTAGADAVTQILIAAAGSESPLVALAQRIERDLIARIGRLISAHERRASRARFDRFGSLARAPQGGAA